MKDLQGEVTLKVGGASVISDTLGNRLTRSSTTSYSWGVLNRMKQLANATSTTNYEDRADGMRSLKSNVAGTVFTEYYHDGQMLMEDAVINGTGLTVTRYGLGTRGIDYEEVVRNSCAYDLTKNLKTSSSFYGPASGAPTT